MELCFRSSVFLGQFFELALERLSFFLGFVLLDEIADSADSAGDVALLLADQTQILFHLAQFLVSRLDYLFGVSRLNWLSK